MRRGLLFAALLVCSGVHAMPLGLRTAIWGHSAVRQATPVQDVWTVSFDANGGNVAEASRQVIDGAGVGALPSATRSGYSLVGWFTAASGGTKVSAATAVTADVTWYARWTANRYTVTFVKFGTTVGWSWERDHGSAIGKLPVPARSGYTFDGWYTKGGSRIVETTKVSGDVTLYAHWTPGMCIVTFNADGGTVPEASRQVLCGSAIGEMPVPARNGCLFAGWYTKGGTRIAETTKVSGDVTLYAHWTVVMRTVTFNPAGGVINEAERQVPHGVAIGEMPEPVRSGCLFAGWYTKGGTRIAETTKVSGDVTLYARWVCQVTFNPAGGTVAESERLVLRASAIGEMPVPTRKYRLFAGWCTKAGSLITAATRVSGNVTLYARWITPVFDGDATWIQDGDGNWRNKSILIGGWTSISFVVTGPGTVSFQWRTSSEKGWDYLHFYANGVEQCSAVSGETDWEWVSCDVQSAGEVTLTWEYAKDGSNSIGSDCGWVRDITYTPEKR